MPDCSVRLVVVVIVIAVAAVAITVVVAFDCNKLAIANAIAYFCGQCEILIMILGYYVDLPNDTHTHTHIHIHMHISTTFSITMQINCQQLSAN